MNYYYYVYAKKAIDIKLALSVVQWEIIVNRSSIDEAASSQLTYLLPANPTRHGSGHLNMIFL